MQKALPNSPTPRLKHRRRDQALVLTPGAQRLRARRQRPGADAREEARVADADLLPEGPRRGRKGYRRRLKSARCRSENLVSLRSPWTYDKVRSECEKKEMS